MSEMTDDDEFALRRARLLASLPPAPTPKGVVASVLHPSRFTIDVNPEPLSVSVSCPDATDDEIRAIAERMPVTWFATINGRAAWEILS